VSALPASGRVADPVRRLRRVGTMISGWERFLVVLLLAAIVGGTISSPFFLTASNFRLGISDFMEVAIMALAMTPIVVAREIDLSVASIMGLSSVVLGLLVDASVPLPLALVAVLAVGAAAGSLNAVLIVKVGLPSIVVTIGTLALLRGLSFGLFGQRAVSDFPTWFTDLGIGVVPGTSVPWSLVVFLVLLVAIATVLHRSYVGRHIYAIGLNAETARFSGVGVARVRMALFVVSGMVAAVAALVYTARVSSVRADNGVGLELEVIAAVLLGGVSIFGGRGSLFGVVLSLSLIAALRNAFSLNDVGTEVQDIVIGTLMISAVILPESVARLRARRSERLATDRYHQLRQGAEKEEQ
jgi:rhamnose transport system permease protein